MTIKIQQVNKDIFSSKNFVYRLFVLVYSNQDNNAKSIKSQRYFLSKGLIKNYNFITNGKTFYDQAINSDIKHYEEIRKLVTGQGENYTATCLFDYEYIKNQYKLILIDLSRKKEFNPDPKAFQQIEFVGRLKNIDDINADGAESMFCFNDFGKSKRNQIQIFPRKCNSIINNGKFHKKY